MFCVIWREFEFSEPVLRNVSLRLLFWLGGNWGEGEISWIHCHGPYNPWKFDETFFGCVGASWYERHVPHFNRWPPSVNLKFYNVFKDTCLDWIFHSPIDNGICSLHVINGAFRPGAEASGWKLTPSRLTCLHRKLYQHHTFVALAGLTTRGHLIKLFCYGKTLLLHPSFGRVSSRRKGHLPKVM